MSENNSSIRSIYEKLRNLSIDELIAEINQYLYFDEVNMLALKDIEKSKFIDLRKLSSLLLWMTKIKGYRIINVGLVENTETNELLFVIIYIDRCGSDWNGWEKLSKFVKSRLNEEGFSDIAGKIAIVCEEALQNIDKN